MSDYDPNALISNDELKEKMKDRPGETVTMDYMESRITETTYQVLPKSTVTLCNIVIDNGYSVRGESACVDPKNFDEEMGKKIAHDNAMNKLWPLFGFALAEKRHILK